MSLRACAAASQANATSRRQLFVINPAQAVKEAA